MSSIRSFIPLQKLGEGTYSNVYKVRRVDDDEIYALKKVKLSTLTLKEKQNSLNEVRILASIESPNIVAYKQAFFDQSLNVLCVVMQFANSGDVQKQIQSHTKSYKRIPEQQIWLAAGHILKGLQTLHSRGILHRDLKCANIFRHNSIYKLGDLNVSKVNNNTSNLCYTQTGTPYYASPEVWRDEPYGMKSDVWSFGCILYEMAALRPPFTGKDMEELFKNVQKAKLTRFSNEYSAELWQFVSLCLQKDASKRPTASQLLKLLKKCHSSTTNNNSNLKIIPETNKLLQTIKVPVDLKKLNAALPISKYKTETYSNKQSDKIMNGKQNKNKEKQIIAEQIKQKQMIVAKNKLLSMVQFQIESGKVYGGSARKKETSKQSLGKVDLVGADKPQSNGSNVSRLIENMSRPGQNKSAIQLPSSSHDRKDKSLVMVNDILPGSYRSPKNNSSHAGRLVKSPASEMRLGRKVESGHSQRLQQSDRKPSTASKVERMQRHLNDMTELLKKPISMPRTEKNVINASHLIEPAHQVIQQNKLLQNNYSYIPSNYHSGQETKVTATRHMLRQQALDDWRNKLIKKNRILSSGLSKPSWG